ncbi:TonB-dependent receptor [Porticoccaceae bacterium LTM1]|nr:TonB-dependent receptor [Porticoccaceae bacterium LTM1]
MGLSKKLFRANRIALAVAAASVMASTFNASAELERVKFELKKSDLSKALMAMSEQAGVQIAIPGDLKNSTVKVELSGEYTVAEALDVLLSGTGLKYRFASDDLILIASADQGNDGSSGDDDENIEEIVVTGTSLKKQDLSAPVTIYTKEEMERRGISSVEDFVRSLSGNQSSINDATSLNIENPEGLSTQPNLTYNIQGESAANLRGMGAESTLVLVNGRRIPKSPTVDNSYVDLNGIPFDAIDRVEVLMDAASAKYGSDAVGGVINFILKKEFVGATTKFRVEDSKNGGDKYTLSQTLGFGWETGSGLLTLTKDEVKPTLTKKADWTTMDLREWGGTDQRLTIYGQPGIVSRFDGTRWVRVGSLPEGDDGTDFTVDDLSLDNLVPTDLRLRKTLSSERDREAIYLSLNNDFSDSLTSYFNASYSKNTTVAEKTTPLLSSYYVPESNYYNNTGEDLRVSYAMDNEVAAGLLPQTTGVAESNMFNLSGGLSYDLGVNDWTVDLNLSYGQSKFSSDQYRFNTDRCGGVARFDFSQDVDGDGDRDVVCRDFETNEIVEVTDGLWGLIASSDPDVAFNPFGDGSVQSSQLQSRYEYFSAAGPVNTEYTVGVDAEGELFDLPGGTIRMAVGAEHRVVTQDYQTQSRAAFTGGELKPQQYIDSMYVETSIPLFGKDNAIPGIQSLELNLQARYNDYNIPDGATQSYSNTTPRIGLSWKPHEDVVIRGTWTEGFRAPSNTEIIGPNQASFVSARPVFDPYDPSGNTTLRFVRLINWNGPVWFSNTSGFFPSVTDDPELAVVTIPTLEMKPETSDNYTFGVDWSPAFLEGLELKATYTRVDYENRIAALNYFSYPMDVLLNIPGYGLRDPDTGRLIGIRSGLINAGERKLEAVDFDVTYDFETSVGNFRAGLTGTYTGTLEDAPVPGLQTLSRNGAQYGPDFWKGRAFLEWYDGDFSATFTTNYSSSYENVARSLNSSGDLVETTEPVEHYTTFDLTGRYSNAESGWTVLAGVRNLTDTDFPFINGNNGRPWDFQRVDARGRVMYMEFKKAFDL